MSKNKFTDDDILKLHKLLSMSIELGEKRDERIARLEQVVAGLLGRAEKQAQREKAFEEPEGAVVIWLN